MLEQDNETIILNNPSLSEEELEELFACKALVGNPTGVLQNVMAFEKFCFAVNGIIPNPESVDVPNVLMIAAAIQKAQKLLDKKELFTEVSDHNTVCYIAHVAFDEGWVILPTILSFAQKELDKLTSDYAKEIFKDQTIESLMNTEPFDDENAISNHCSKMQALKEYLKVLN